MKTSILLLGIILSSCLVKGQNSSMNYKIIVDSISIYKSVDNILEMEELKNRVVYVDIWGTRCPPCLTEFEYIPLLKKRFKNDSIVFLYLCSPYSMHWDKKNEELWQKIIKKHNLEGIHVLISAECYMSGFFERYKGKYTENRLYGIPTYLLVDKHGEIVDFDAPRPSSNEVLYNEIQKLLDKK